PAQLASNGHRRPRVRQRLLCARTNRWSGKDGPDPPSFGLLQGGSGGGDVLAGDPHRLEERDRPFGDVFAGEDLAEGGVGLSLGGEDVSRFGSGRLAVVDD